MLSDNGINVDLEKLNLNDPEIYTMLRQGKTLGVFQFESEGMRKMIKDIGVSSFNELIVAVSLYRPGPLHNGMVQEYIINKKNKQWTKKPLTAKIMYDSEGIILYQEHIMEIVQEMAGLSETEADDFRKAITEADDTIVESYKKQFIDGCKVKGYAKDVASTSFDKIKNFAKYSFNKAHATSYAMIAFYTAYLKKYHYKEYMMCYINNELSGGDIDNARVIVRDMIENKVVFNKMNVNRSKEFCTIINGNIQPGLLFVDFVGINAATVIVKKAPYSSYEDFEAKVKGTRQINKRNKESLKKKEAFEDLA
jgi:DNA polymerase-3 subunit alpha